MDWNDLKFFLTLAQARSLSAAAVELGVSPSTVARRVEALEQALQATLFRPHRDGYDLTEAGAGLVPAAERAAAQLRLFERSAMEGRDALAGEVRIEVPELLGQEVVLPALARLMSDHPGLRIDLRSSVLPTRLASEEADLILRLVRPAKGNYRMTRLGAIRFGLYASTEHAGRHGTPERAEELPQHRIIGWTEDLGFLIMASWLRQLCPGLRPQLRLMSFAAQLEAVRNQAGWAVLPDFAAVPAGFVAGLVGVPRLAPDLWLLTHEQTQSLPRVQLVRNCLVAAFRAKIAATPEDG